MRHIPFESDEMMDVMESWPHEDKMGAARDALLYGNVYVDADGRYVPSEQVTE